MGNEWRAFYGEAGEWSYLDVTGTWRQARDALMAELEPFRTDECPHCQARGTAVLDGLAGLAENTGFRDEVDGRDVILLSVPS